MRFVFWPIISFLVFALVVQNTCPRGFAGKTTLAGKCSHCSSKINSITLPEVQVFTSSFPRPVHFPMYVFVTTDTSPFFQPQRRSATWPILIIGYEAPWPDELLKPPRAYSLPEIHWHHHYHV